MMGTFWPATDTLTSIPSSPSAASASLPSFAEGGLGEPPLVEAVPCSLASAPDEELLDDELVDDELLEDLLELLDGNDAVEPGAPGIDGLEAEDDDEELGIDGADGEEGEDWDELGIEGDELGVEGDDGDELGIDGMEEELELDWVDSQPASTRPSIMALARALKGGRGLLMGILH